MGSSGGGGGNPSLMMQAASPMAGIPIAGQGGGVGNPFEYGYFQNFLPDAPAAGQPMQSATGLTSDMMQYRAPQSGQMAPSNADLMRNELAALQAKMAAMQQKPAEQKPREPVWEQYYAGGNS